MPIRKLSEDVASKIAAGEVVERPVSVVKELLENALDAHANEITISIEEAGRRLIEVNDDGDGIPQGDLALAVERYATSKINAAEDLEKVKTLGFRGEALASISSVSRFLIESRVAESQVGFAVAMDGGRIQPAKEIARPVGTRVMVRDLFYNVPARLKFLKADITEKRQINRMVARYALHYANTRITLFQDGNRVFSSHGSGDRVEILTEMFGIENARSLLPLAYSDEYLAISGYTSPHHLTRASRNDIFFFINGRLVSDTGIASAISKAYQGMIMVGRYPISVLFMDVDPGELDVNVHPTKTEVRLKDSSRVFSGVHRAVRKTIAAYSPVPAFPQSLWSYSAGQDDERGKEDRIPSASLFVEQEISQDAQQSAQGAQLPSAGNLPLLRLIGQLGLTYLAAEGPDGLYLIDQHAAHERILFERLAYSASPERSQYLLEPAVVSIPLMDAEEMESRIGIARELGFQIEDFGPGAFKITAVPQILSAYDLQTSFMGLFGEDDEDKGGGLLEAEKKEAIIKRICKRLAIKGGQSLSSPEQEKLIRDLESCQNPRTCPHGRPAIIHISVDALERRFGRTGSL
jgi:DNA mismatch repair protein MutL